MNDYMNTLRAGERDENHSGFHVLHSHGRGFAIFTLCSSTRIETDYQHLIPCLLDKFTLIGSMIYVACIPFASSRTVASEHFC